MSYSEADDIATHVDDVKNLHDILTYVGLPHAVAGRILDVGGGGGVHSALLAREGARVICTDFIDQNARYGGAFMQLLHEKMARHQLDFDLRAMEFHAADAMDMPYRDNNFDMVVSFNALEHIPCPDRAVAEMLRVLKPGGLLYITFDPMWSCDSGSHFGHRVPLPWQHLIDSDDEFVARMRAAGAAGEEIDDYCFAMNRQRLDAYREVFARCRAQAEMLSEFEWSGCTDPGNPDHPNFQRCLELGYRPEELMTRGMRKLMRKHTA